MNPAQREFYKNLKENPDLDYINEEDEVFYCKSCLSTAINITKTSKVYCYFCKKYLIELSQLNEVCINAR